MPSGSGCTAKRRQEGITYLAILAAVAVLGIGMAATGELWQTGAKRQREKDLLAVGKEFRQAIQAYYDGTPGGVKQYPRRLEDLIKDNRFPGVHRHLRRIYADPMTGEANWGLVKNPQGEIIGVYSQSKERPLKTGGFGRGEVGFAKAEHYSDWRFTALPSSTVQQPRPPGQ